MAIIYDAATNINNVGVPSTSVSGSHTIGSGSNIIVWVFMSYNAGTHNGITYNGVAMTYAGIFCTNGGSVTVAYYLINPPTGTNTVVGNTTASATILLAVHSYFGVHQSTPIDTSNVSNSIASGSTVDTTVVTTKDVSWVIGVTRSTFATSLVGSVFTQRVNQSNLYISADTNSQVDLAGTSITYSVDRTAGIGTFSQIVIAMRAYTINSSLSETITLVDTLRRSVSRRLSEVVTLVDIFRRSTSRRLAEVVTIVDSISKTKVTVKSLSEVITIIDTLRRMTGKSLREVVTIVDRVSRLSTRRFTETITVTDRVIRAAYKRFVESITLSDSFVLSRRKNFYETVTIIDKPIRFLMSAIGYILGRNNNTGIKLGTRASTEGLNKNTGIKTGTKTDNIGKNNNTGTKTGTKL